MNTIRMTREEYFARLANYGWTSGAAPTLADELMIFGGKVEIIFRRPPEQKPIPIKSDRLSDFGNEWHWWDYMFLGWEITFILFCVWFVISLIVSHGSVH